MVLHFTKEWGGVRENLRIVTYIIILLGTFNPFISDIRNTEVYITIFVFVVFVFPFAK